MGKIKRERGAARLHERVGREKAFDCNKLVLTTNSVPSLSQRCKRAAPRSSQVIQTNSAVYHLFLQILQETNGKYSDRISLFH